MYKVLSLQIADSIDIKSFKNIFTAELIFSDSDSLFYKVDSKRFICVFKYGVVSFLNHDDVRVAEFIHLISTYCKNFFEIRLREEFKIDTDSKKTSFGHNEISIAKPSEEALRVIMLNVSQSVALYYYSEQTDVLLKETNKHTLLLEKNGSLDISGRKLKKFIGKTLNLKNRITENLYIFDSAPGTWEDEKLDKIDIGLKKTFDLQSRYRILHEELEIVKENLELFKDLLQHRNSSNLEWIIIALIMVEVVNLFIERIF